MVKCIDASDLDTYFRCILTEEELQKFSDALQIASHEYDAKDTINIIHHDHSTTGRISLFLAPLYTALHTCVPTMQETIAGEIPPLQVLSYFLSLKTCL
jgi:hypothetical protein